MKTRKKNPILNCKFYHLRFCVQVNLIKCSLRHLLDFTRLSGSEQKPQKWLNVTSSASIQRAPLCGLNVSYMHLTRYLEQFEAVGRSLPLIMTILKHMLVDTITYLKYKVRSVDRMACFSSCIMLLYSLEDRLAKMLWPCKKRRKRWQMLHPIVREDWGKMSKLANWVTRLI